MQILSPTDIRKPQQRDIKDKKYVGFEALFDRKSKKIFY